MGVSLYMRECEFFMQKKNVPLALASVNARKGSEFDDLNDAFQQFADLVAEIDVDDNVNSLTYDGGKCMECRGEFFADIAPFVEAGSWIQWETEEGYLYRDYFNGEGVEELECHIIAEDPKDGPILPKVGEKGIAPFELSEKLMKLIVDAAKEVRETPDIGLSPNGAWDAAALYVAEYTARNLFHARLMERGHGRMVIEAMGGVLSEADRWDEDKS